MPTVRAIPDDPSTDARRRRVLLIAASVPLLLAMGRLAGGLLGGLENGLAAAASRPAGVGSTAHRCARCGAGDHTMLDPSCPLEPSVSSPARG